jgi:uncharacterized protein (TIGR03118 family)
MRWFNGLRKLVARKHFVRDTAHKKSHRFRPNMEPLEDRRLMATAFLQTNLVSDIPGMANVPDGHLLNPWGLTSSDKSAFWVSDNNGGVSTLYDGQGNIVPLVVNIPTNTPGVLGSPSGTVFNTAQTGFNVSETVGGITKTGSSVFLFVTEDGLIAGWSFSVDRNNAIPEITNPAAGYKGLAIGTDSAGDTLLYAANIAQGTIDVYDQNFHLVQGAAGDTGGPSTITLKGNFTDPNLPAGYAPFNIQNLGGKLYVEYAKYDPTTTEGAPGAGSGFVDVYSTDGVLLSPNHQNHLISGGALNAPWGVAMAPANFGQFSNDLLVGNFGDGHINAFDPTSGKLLGQLTLDNGQPFQEDELWALRFGNGAGSGPTNTLFFTAGINDQKDGLFGSLQAITTLKRHDPVVPALPSAATQILNTVPAVNGDLNPYGVAFVPQGFEGKGTIQPGDLLVSNFNDSANVQGTGSTIVRIAPDGSNSVFFDGIPGQSIGLTTALGVLKSGFVIVGNVPTDANGNAQQGSLLILDANGKVVTQLSDNVLLNGPWDLTVNDQGDQAQVFVSNVLSGTVTRIDLSIPDGGAPIIEAETQIASGYGHRTDPTALVVGPTGLAFDASRHILYVASTADNAIYAIAHADSIGGDHGTGRLVFNDATHLHGPLGLVLAPNGDLIASNGDAVKPDPNNLNEVVEFTPEGKFVAQFQFDNTVDANNKIIPGAAFGLAISTDNGETRLAAVDDNSNTVHIFTFERKSPGGDQGHDADAMADLLAAMFADQHRHKAGDPWSMW